MIISVAHSFVLAHIPKNGGTTVQEALTPLVEQDLRDVVLLPRHRLRRDEEGTPAIRPMAKARFASEKHWRSREKRSLDWPEDALNAATPDASLTKHATFSELKSYLSPRFYGELAQAVIVRNPYARAYSAYRFYLRKAQESGKMAEQLIPGGAPVDIETFYREPSLTDKLFGTVSQAHWLDPDRAPEHVLRLETLASDMRGFLTTVGYDQGSVDRTADFLGGNRRNATSKRDEWETMSAAAKKIIADRYASDFEAFGYDPGMTGPVEQ